MAHVSTEHVIAEQAGLGRIAQHEPARMGVLGTVFAAILPVIVILDSLLMIAVRFNVQMIAPDKELATMGLVTVSAASEVLIVP
jgi:hypothetical protein